MMKTILVIVFGVLMFASCSKSALDSPGQLIGKWTETEVYGNDFWGGPFYWKNATGNIKVEFTSDKKYYRKTPESLSFTLIGTYKVLSDNKLEITPVIPSNPSYPTYTLDFRFEKDGQLVLGNAATEGVIEEKFRLER